MDSTRRTTLMLSTILTPRLPLAQIRKKRDVRSRSGYRSEVESDLFMALWVLLSSQHAQQLRPVVLNKEGPCHLSVARQTEREHLRRIAVPRFPVMDGN